MARQKMTEQRWAEATHWPLIVASVLWLIAYSWKVIADVSGVGAIGLWIVIGGTYAFFVVDYLVRLMLADPRAPWFRAHLLDLAIVAIPMLRVLRLLRVLTAFRFGKQSAGTALRNRIAVYGVGASLLVIYLCALAVLEAERGVPGANIETFGDAIWWAFVTVATVGYGDFFPVTAVGRMWAVGLMASGIAIVGTVTATVSSWVIELASQGRDDNEPSTRGQMRELLKEVSDLRQQLAQAEQTSKE